MNKPTSTKPALAVALLRAGIVARKEPGRARGILIAAGMPYLEASLEVLDARSRWVLLQREVKRDPS